MTRLLLLGFLLFSLAANAQTNPLNHTVRADATVTSQPPAITLEWLPSNASLGYTIYRKLKGETSWGNPIATLPDTDLSYTDNNVQTGISYEYKIFSDRPSYPDGYGYLNAGIKLPPIENRGSMLVIIDKTFEYSLALPIAQLKQDLVGDGWQVFIIYVYPNESVPSIKNQIQNLYTSISDLKAVYLLGHVPVPYSGNIAPDGHGNHRGAWPADGYYGDMDGLWTDQTVNNTTSSYVKNRNIPGDGKFDQSNFPGAIELQVGRVDLNDLPAFTENEQTLLANYLQKAHAFKHKEFVPEMQAVVDDHFLSFSEGFSQNGHRNFSSMLGKDKVIIADYFTSFATDSYIWSYGCGGGNFTGANGIGNTGSFVSNSPEGVFTMLFGSYFGDWNTTNNFLRAPLASSGKMLTNVWAGRPHWYMHGMSMGDNIGESTHLTMNNTNVYVPGGSSTRGVHMGLMGDPSLRLHIVAPPMNFAANVVGNSAALTWQAASDPNILGYYIYRSVDECGPYTRIDSIGTSQLGYNYTDSNLPEGTHHYMVRTLKLEEGNTGTYCNLSQGVFDQVTITQNCGWSASISVIANVTCFGTNGGVAAVSILGGGGQTYSYQWSNGATLPVANGLMAGIVTVTITDSTSCAVMLSTTITEPQAITSSSQLVQGVVCGVGGSASVSSMGGINPHTILWENGETDFTATNLQFGINNFTITDANGCEHLSSADINQGTISPEMEIMLLSKDDCTSAVGNGIAVAKIISGVAPYQYQWSSGETQQKIHNLNIGTYTVTVTSANGCTATESIIVECQQCGTLFTDSGGSGNYSNLEYSEWTYCPDETCSKVSVSFSSFMVEADTTNYCFDNLYIYNGDAVDQSKIIPPFTYYDGWCFDGYGGTSNLTGKTVTSSDPTGCLTFVFTSDAQNTLSGWQAKVNCVPKAADCVDIQLHAYLEGPFDEATMEMGTWLNLKAGDLLHRGMLPGQNPVNSTSTSTPPGNPFWMAPWQYYGTSREASFDGPYDEEVVDWVLVTFRSGTTPNTRVAKANGLLKKDGSIEFLEPCVLSSCTAPGDSSFYIVIEHRNHIGIMSPMSVPVVNGVLAWDFRMQNSYITQSSFGQKELIPGTYAMFAGDAFQLLDGFSYDINGNDLQQIRLENGDFDSYTSKDCNMDADVNGVDLLYFRNNNGTSSGVPREYRGGTNVSARHTMPDDQLPEPLPLQEPLKIQKTVE